MHIKAARNIVYFILVLYFLSRMYMSAMKLSRAETSFSEEVITESEIFYPSITLCPVFHPFFGLDYLFMFDNMTQIYETCSAELPKLIWNLRHEFVLNGKERQIADMIPSAVSGTYERSIKHPLR